MQCALPCALCSMCILGNTGTGSHVLVQSFEPMIGLTCGRRFDVTDSVGGHKKQDLRLGLEFNMVLKACVYFGLACPNPWAGTKTLIDIISCWILDANYCSSFVAVDSFGFFTYWFYSANAFTLAANQ